MGSPVDVAKSYMRARPPWASPSTNNFDFKSPSPLGLQLFKEETSYLISGNPLSSSKVPFYLLNYTHDASPGHFSILQLFSMVVISSHYQLKVQLINTFSSFSKSCSKYST